jgi:ABC-type transport system involved in multi-copper enzyme maturation permease subunit
VRPTLIIARLTFKEAARRKILLAAALLGIAFLAIYAYGFHAIQADLREPGSAPNRLQLNEIYGFLMMAGLYVVNFLTLAMAVLTSVDTVSGEIASGTIHTVLSKPMRRRELVLGKWLGFAGMVTLYLLLMGGGVMAVVNVLGDYVAPNPLRGLGLIWLNAILLLSLSILGGTVLSTLANGVLVFGLYGLAFVGGWIEQIGSILQNETAVNIGILSSLILPSEALWKRAAYEMQSTLVRSIGITPFSAVSTPSALMVGYAMVYVALAVWLALRLFNRRDL